MISMPTSWRIMNWWKSSELFSTVSDITVTLSLSHALLHCVTSRSRAVTSARDDAPPPPPGLGWAVCKWGRQSDIKLVFNYTEQTREKSDETDQNIACPLTCTASRYLSCENLELWNNILKISFLHFFWHFKYIHLPFWKIEILVLRSNSFYLF